MTVWAISDLHLSFSNAKPMHIFGEHWRGHPQHIARTWKERVAETDIVLVPGDLSWANRFAGALPDLRWIADLPGAHKLIVRGNHDHWWPTTPQEREKTGRIWEAEYLGEFPNVPPRRP